MLEGIEALIALEESGTVSEAAVRLRLTQSAVSKRIRALQASLGFRLVEPVGRRLRLTAAGIEFVARARPLIAELRVLGSSVNAAAASTFSLAVADSIASTWGPRIVRRALERSPGIEVSLHAHRSALIIESVRLGRFQIGLCTDSGADDDLIHFRLVDEPMVIANCFFEDVAAPGQPLICVESGTAAWKVIEPMLRTHQPALLKRHMTRVESFGATLQMVKAGFGDGLIPLGMILEAGLAPRGYRLLEHVHRPVSLLTRKTVHHLAAFARFREQLAIAATGYFAATSGSLMTGRVAARRG